MTDVSHVSEDATQVQNAADVMTPILTISPEEGQALLFRGWVASGDEIGIPIYAKLFNGTGNDLPLDTDMVLRYDDTTQDQPMAVSTKKRNLRAYRNLSITEQGDTEKIDAVKHRIKNSPSVVEVPHTAELQVAIKSADVIDWSQGSELYFDENAVREVPADKADKIAERMIEQFSGGE